MIIAVRQKGKIMDDLISRKDVIDFLIEEEHRECKDWREYDDEASFGAMNAYSRMRKYVKLFPSAQPERKKGKWIPYDIPWYKCSECGAVREHPTFLEYYCPNCGADMRGEQNDTND